MAEDYVPTIRIRRPAKVTTDDRGRTVWADTVVTAELELVSTSELQKILASSDDDTRCAIERIVTGEEAGVLARDLATGLFEIISDADLQAILDADLQAILAENGNRPMTYRTRDVKLERSGSKAANAGDELSLFSTQVLRKVLATETPKKTQPKVKGGGFDPYNSG
jgi:hypothetical protein